jgi:hypothetical protein
LLMETLAGGIGMQGGEEIIDGGFALIKDFN